MLEQADVEEEEEAEEAAAAAAVEVDFMQVTILLKLKIGKLIAPMLSHHLTAFTQWNISLERHIVTLPCLHNMHTAITNNILMGDTHLQWDTSHQWIPMERLQGMQPHQDICIMLAATSCSLAVLSNLLSNFVLLSCVEVQSEKLIIYNKNSEFYGHQSFISTSSQSSWGTDCSQGLTMYYW